MIVVHASNFLVFSLSYPAALAGLLQLPAKAHKERLADMYFI